MSYTVWSRGRLIGHTDLGFIYRENGHRCGFFHPTEIGEPLMEIATGVSPAMLAAREKDYDRTSQADVAAAVDRCDALALELHDAGGNVIPCDDIYIRDTQFIMSLVDDERDEAEFDAWYAALTDEARARFDADVEHDAAIINEWFGKDFSSSGDEPWAEDDFPRYQIQIQLIQHDAIP